MQVGDLVIDRSQACLGIIVEKALKPQYFWVQWVTGKQKEKRTLKWKEMLYIYKGDKNGTHLLDWG